MLKRRTCRIWKQIYSLSDLGHLSLNNGYDLLFLSVWNNIKPFSQTLKFKLNNEIYILRKLLAYK